MPDTRTEEEAEREREEWMGRQRSGSIMTVGTVPQPPRSA